MKNSFDDILKKKWEEFQFPVDDGHRDAMISLLNQHNRRRTGLFWWFGGIGGGIVIMAAVILLSNRNEAIDQQKPVQPSVNVQKEDMAQTKELNENPQVTSPKNQVTENDVANEEAMHDGKQIKSSMSTAENTTQHNNSKSISKQNANANNIMQTDSRTISDPKNTVDATVVTQANPNVPAADDHGELNKTNFHVPADVITEPILTSSPVSLEQSTSFAENQIAEGHRSSVIFEVLDPLTIGLLPNEREKLKPLEPVIVKHHPVYLFAETGSGFIPASQPSFSSGWTFKAGGGIDYGLNSKQHISLSMGYLLQKDGFDFEKSSTVQQPAFGTRSNFHTLSPDKLHFVYTRVGIHQRIHRHVLSLSGGVQYLYGAQGSIVVQTQDQWTGDSENVYNNVWLKLDGLTRWMWNGEVQYGYQLTPKMSLHTGLKINFTSLEASDNALKAEGYYWDGKTSTVNPTVTINYHLYGKK